MPRNQKPSPAEPEPHAKPPAVEDMPGIVVVNKKHWKVLGRTTRRVPTLEELEDARRKRACEFVSRHVSALAAAPVVDADGPALTPRMLRMVGQRSGALTVTRGHGRAGKLILLVCSCDCGNECVAERTLLEAGKVTHCGCGAWPPNPQEFVRSEGSR